MANPKKIETRGREGRTPINGSRNIMTVKGIDETKFHPCWVNDIDDNLGKYLEAGYEFVTDSGEIQVGDRRINSDSQLGSKVSKNVGNNVTAFLMVVPIEYYEEDMAKYSQEIDEQERGLIQSTKDTVDGSYGSLKISRG